MSYLKNDPISSHVNAIPYLITDRDGTWCDPHWHPPMARPGHTDTDEFLKARIKGLSAVVTDINARLQTHGCHTGSLDLDNISNKKERDVDRAVLDRVAYASKMHRLHQNLISANQELAARVEECQGRGMSPNDAKDAFWPNVLMPGSSELGTVVLKDYGKAVDNAFFALMNFLADVQPVDSLAFIKKRNTLLNDKLVTLMETRKCQLQLLGLHDTEPFSLSEWTLYDRRELSGTPCIPLESMND